MHPHRPAVEDDVVYDEDQRVTARVEPHERGAKQRRLLEVEGRAGQLAGQAQGFGLALALGHVLEVEHRQPQGLMRGDDLHEAPLFPPKARPQDLVPAHGLVDASVEQVYSKRAFEAQDDSLVVDGAVGVPLVLEPHPLLSEGCGKGSPVSRETGDPARCGLSASPEQSLPQERSFFG
jgi:hypothetical protein